MLTSKPPVPSSFPLPAVHNSLVPFIHPPSETLNIQQSVTQHLTNLAAEKRITDGSGSQDEFQRFLDFELGRKVSGIAVRKEYLMALRANHEAKKEYELAVCEGEEDEEDEGEAEKTRQGTGLEDGWREEYLNTLKLRRQHERLELLRVYLNTVSNPSPEDLIAEAAVGGFNEPPPAPPVQLTAQKPTTTVGSSNEEIMAGVEQMILRLEKEVVGIYDVLETEKIRIQDLQEGMRDNAQGSKKEALLRARDTLISWIEGQLVRTTAGGEPAPDEDDSMAVSEESDIQTAEQVVDIIHSTYREYLKSREQLVHVLASASSGIWDQPLVVDRPSTILTPPPAMKKMVPAPPILQALTAMEHLLPLVKYQKSLLSQKTQLSAALSALQKRLLSLLELLFDQQSHPFPNITAATTSPSIEMVQSLTAASKSASQAVYRAVNQKIVDAMKTLEGVEGVLLEVESLVIAPKKDKEVVSKIPMAKKKKVKGRRGEEGETPEKGLWGALGGRVGVIGDGI